MKKTKLLTGFVLFCIVLSFFSVVFADGDKITFLPKSTVQKSITCSTYNKSPDEGGPRSSDNTYKINIIGKNQHAAIRCNKTGVYTISLKNKNGESATDYTIYEANAADHWEDLAHTPFANIAGYKDGDTYKLFSPATSKNSKDTTVKVYLYEGTEYVITNWVGSNYELEIYYSNADNNNKETYDSGVSSRKRTLYPDGATKGSLGKTGATVRNPNPDGADYEEPEDTASGLTATENKFEEMFVKFLLSVGDFFVKLIEDIVGSEVTITRIIFNGADGISIPALNPNLFDSTNSNLMGINISQVISDWYNVFRSLAFVFYIISLLLIGIHVLLNSTAQGTAKAKSLLVEWFKGILLLILMPMFIKYLFDINESLVKMIYEKAFGDTIGETTIKYSDGSEWSVNAIEFRSPEYVSKYTGSVALGSEEATTSYISKISSYQASFDLMRIARAYTGATYRIGYALIWFVLIGQLLVFVVMYYKRYFTILFLIAAFPIICIFHAISVMKGMNKGPEISNWLKKLIEQIFIQTIHAIIFALITGVCMTMFAEQIRGGVSGVNWLLIIIAVNFVPEGEKILKRILNSIGGSGGGMSEQAKGIKGIIGKVSDNAKKFMGRVPKE